MDIERLVEEKLAEEYGDENGFDVDVVPNKRGSGGHQFVDLCRCVRGPPCFVRGGADAVHEESVGKDWSITKRR